MQYEFSNIIAYKAPWPQGTKAMWWMKECYTLRAFVNSTAYADLVDARRFFWSLRHALCQQQCSVLKQTLGRQGPLHAHTTGSVSFLLNVATYVS
jgi:hypothetical protein